MLLSLIYRCMTDISISFIYTGGDKPLYFNSNI